MAKRMTLVLRVSDDTSEMFQEWIDNATDRVLFMGTVTEVIEMRLEPDSPWPRLKIEDISMVEPNPIDTFRRQYRQYLEEQVSEEPTSNVIAGTVIASSAEGTSSSRSLPSGMIDADTGDE